MFWHCGMSASTANFFAGRKVCNSFFLSKTRHMVPTKQTKSRRARWAVTRERAADFACIVSTTMYSVCVRVFPCVCECVWYVLAHTWTILFLFGFYSTLEGVFTLATRLQRQKEDCNSLAASTGELCPSAASPYRWYSALMFPFTCMVCIHIYEVNVREWGCKVSQLINFI